MKRSLVTVEKVFYLMRCLFVQLFVVVEWHPDMYIVHF